jgi:transcriptional regulator with XRE-family HTH domain
MGKMKPRLEIGKVIRAHRDARGMSQGDIQRRTGLLRCYISRVENGHTVPALETLAKIAESMDLNLADFFPGADSPQSRDIQKALLELSKPELKVLTEMHKCSAMLSENDKRLVLGVIRKMASDVARPFNGIPRFLPPKNRY